MNNDKTENNKEQSQEQSSSTMISTNASSINKQEPDKSRNNTTKKKSITTQFWEQPINVKLTLLFDFLLLIATSVYATFAYFQWKTMSGQLLIINKQADIMAKQSETLDRQAQIMDKQADISSKQMINGERAWITVDNLESKEVKEQVPRDVFITIVNSGNSPALNTRIFSAWGVYESEPIPMPDIDQSSEPTVSHTVMGARSAKQQTGPSFNLSDEQVRLVKQQTHYLYVWGIIKYEDIFGQGRTTKFCEVYVYYTTKPGWKYCADTNTAN